MICKFRDTQHSIAMPLNGPCVKTTDLCPELFGAWRRPLRVLVEDCRVMIDVEARNAIIAMVMHLISAFKMPARPRTPQARPCSSATPGAFRDTCFHCP